MWKKSPTEPKQCFPSLKEANEVEETNVSKAEALREATAEIQPNVSVKKKRKKNKNNNAGLLFTLNKDDNSVTKVVNISQKMQTMNIQKTMNVPNHFDKNANQPLSKNKGLPQSQSKGKSKNKSAKFTKNLSQPAVKRNSILHLANALKAKGSQSGSNSQADKLKQMLR